MKIMIQGNFEGLTESHIQQIRAASEEHEVVVALSQDDQLAHGHDVDVFLGSFSRALFEAAKNLKWVHTIAAGVDRMLFDEFVKSPIIFSSAKGTVGTHLAEHAWALLLGLLRRIGMAVRERTWEIRETAWRDTWELGGRTLGIIGLGGTGVEVARRAVGFDMTTIAIDPEDVPRPDFVREVWKPGRIYDLLEQSDVVVVCAPLTKLTRGMFDMAAFRHMKPHALLINVARGPIVDEQSLIQALEQNLIGGAGLDVTPQEPLPAESPLWDMDNAIITPHVAGESPFRIDRSVDLFCENLKRFSEGRPILSEIDKEKGY